MNSNFKIYFAQVPDEKKMYSHQKKVPKCPGITWVLDQENSKEMKWFFRVLPIHFKNTFCWLFISKIITEVDLGSTRSLWKLIVVIYHICTMLEHPVWMILMWMPCVLYFSQGAGHMVPQDKPIPALEFFTNFLQNKPFQWLSLTDDLEMVPVVLSVSIRRQ